jgi:pimeloyl-ACP methyl ester carboxylesterase
MTRIDGVDIHFLHLRSPEPDATPLVMTHGWPGSVFEFLEVAPLLADPAAHGGDPADAFHVALPSLPGFGLSGKPDKPGWTPERIAQAWVELMRRLGYDQFVAQGGDWGFSVANVLGSIGAPTVSAVHFNMFPIFESMEAIDAQEKRALERLQASRTTSRATESRRFRARRRWGTRSPTPRWGRRHGCTRSTSSGPTTTATRSRR